MLYLKFPSTLHQKGNYFPLISYVIGRNKQTKLVIQAGHNVLSFLLVSMSMEKLWYAEAPKWISIEIAIPSKVCTKYRKPKPYLAAPNLVLNFEYLVLLSFLTDAEL